MTLSARRRFLAFATLILAGLWTGASEAQAQSYWPKGSWRTSTPEAQGVDSAVLVQAFGHIREHRLRIHSLTIIRNGYAIVDAYFYPFARGERHDVASVTKSVTSTLVGRAIGQGWISDINQPALAFFPDASIANISAQKRAVTVAHLLSMTSGLDCKAGRGGELTLMDMLGSPNWTQFTLDRVMAFEPGTHFEYCSPGMHLLSAIVAKASGRPASNLARHDLFAPLGIANVAWPSDAQGVTYGWGDLELEPVDMAKVGYFWLGGGRWAGRQILPDAYLHAASRVQSRSANGEGYGFGFWVNPDAGLFEAMGRGGQRISVLPTQNTVVVITGGGFEPGEISGLLLKAIKADAPLPENPAAVLALNDAITRAAKRPFDGKAALPKTPDWTDRINGKRYAVDANPWRLSSFGFEFHPRKAPLLTLRFADSHKERLRIGAASSPIMQGVGKRRALASGSFETDNTITITYDQIARIDNFELRFEFAGGEATIHMLETSEPARFVARAHQAGN